MPFTLAHPLAVMPWVRTRLVLSALVAGSMSPDFEYALGRMPMGWRSHTIPGLFLLCLPAGLVMLWLWHALFKRALVQLLPTSHYRKLLPLCGQFRFGPASRLVTIVLSVLLGAFTHVAWDAFTHGYGPGVRYFPVLQAPLLQTRYGPLKVYKVLQHGSTIVGLAVLSVLYARWYARTPGVGDDAKSTLSARARIGVVLALAGTAAVVALWASWVASTPYKGFDAFCIFVVRFCIVSSCVMGVSATAFSLWWIVSPQPSRRPRRTSSPAA